MWIIDFESYQINSAFYPLEICLLNTADQSKCFVYYVKYPCNYFNNLTTKYQFLTHGLTWGEGDETIYSAISSILSKLGPKDVIYVKGLEKKRLVESWVAIDDDKCGVRVREFPIISTPSLNRLVVCIEETCEKHKHLMVKACARRKCFQLLRYLPILL